MKHLEVVCALIYKDNEYGKYFCCKRGPGRALEGYWEFPGGKVQANETHKETIVREIKEELNSIIEPISYIGMTDYIYPDMPPYEGFSITMYAYRCELISGNLELTEHTESAWKTIEEMKEMNFAGADKPFINGLDQSTRKKAILVYHNPSFLEYVEFAETSYSDNIGEAIYFNGSKEILNTPFDRTLYAYFVGSFHLPDGLQKCIEEKYPNRRLSGYWRPEFGRPRPLYVMSLDEALETLRYLAKKGNFDGYIRPRNLDKYADYKEEKEMIKDSRILFGNEKYFEEMEFTCSLTGHKYRTGLYDDGSLYMIDLTLNQEVYSTSTPSRSEIAKTALQDLTGVEEPHLKFYQYVYKLQKIVLK